MDNNDYKSEAIDPDLLPCGVVRIASNRDVSYCNRYALDLWSGGEADDVVVGRAISELVTLATGILLDSYVYPMLLADSVAEEIQLTLKSSSGKSHPIVANFRLNADQTVDWTFMSCINRDRLYTELLETRDRLQEQAVALAQLNDQIRERQADLQAFCFSLSHDFTGPLELIRQFVDVALGNLHARGLDAPDEFRCLESARQNSDVLIDLTEGLVEFLVADVAVPHDEPVDLEDIVSTSLLLRKDDGAVSPIVHRSTLPTIIGNRSQLQVLFTNLLENAIKYNVREPEIWISHTEDTATRRHVIAIRDNGIGMPEERWAQAFEPFARLNTGGRGSGLGLSIVKKMVTNHGGEIWVDSTPDVGSTFFVAFPMEVVKAGGKDEGVQALQAS